MSYSPAKERYEKMSFNRCGRSGLMLPPISLGLWHNFGDVDDFGTARDMVHYAFDHGITHFDLANNYGPPAGSAETNFGKILRAGIGTCRDEMIISSKAGYPMWKGPYGNFGSRKSLLASLDQSLNRMGLEYVDIFYSHRPDPETPLEETMGALATAVRQGKALYAGVSSYSPETTQKAATLLREMGTPLLIHQPCYNMLDRRIESGLTKVLAEEGVGSIVFCPLAQGQLTSRYLDGIPKDSRAARENGFLKTATVKENHAAVERLQEIAVARGQTLAQMAIAWVLRLPEITTALIGASRVAQIEENLRALDQLDFSAEELAAIDETLASA